MGDLTNEKEYIILRTKNVKDAENGRRHRIWNFVMDMLKMACIM